VVIPLFFANSTSIGIRTKGPGFFEAAGVSVVRRGTDLHVLAIRRIELAFDPALQSAAIGSAAIQAQRDHHSQESDM
jgi:hypothetical protein